MKNCGGEIGNDTLSVTQGRVTAVSGRSIVLGHRSRGIMRSLIAKRSAQRTVLMRRIAFCDLERGSEIFKIISATILDS